MTSVPVPCSPGAESSSGSQGTISDRHSSCFLTLTGESFPVASNSTIGYFLLEL